jgi:CRISPR-associated protein Csc2
MFNGYDRHFQKQIPDRPGAYYAHVLLLRRTESYAVFRTDGELNTARVSTGLVDARPMTRLAIFKRKQSTPERLTGRELLRRYGVYELLESRLGKDWKDCVYNVGFCGMCPDCVIYGYAIGETGSEKSKVYVDTAYSLTSYDESHESLTLNAPYEDGTMTKGGETTPRFSEQDHVKPEVYFPAVMTMRDPTPNTLTYLLNNLRRTRLYGAQTTRTGHVENAILALVFADGEIFSNLRLVQTTHDRLNDGAARQSGSDQGAVSAAVLEAARELVKQDGVVYEFVDGQALDRLLTQIHTTFTDPFKIEDFMKGLAEECYAYADRIGVVKAAKKGKGKGPAE